MLKSVIIFIVPFLCCVSAFSSSDSSSRITNGNLATYPQYPYSVSLQRVAQSNTIQRGHKCMGTMITLQHVLTAASCLYDIVNGVSVPITPADYRIFGGSASLLEDGDLNRLRLIANFTIHPSYIPPPASINDIAVITLTQPFLNTTVVPISLPVEDLSVEDFTLCNIASWGSMNATSTASYSLRSTSKFIYNHALCEYVYSQRPSNLNVFHSMVCAASYDIVSSGCTGDIGTALACNGALTGVLVQTNECNFWAYPEIYTRVSNYTTWIRTISASDTIRPELTLFTILAIVTARFISRA